ncbi:polysaccharide pyruvyl transferase family protein [Galbibacter sp. BG1]|uniref:polysaccharide pyruvyl transferase family protein n=1 Tax=Galbibacter sp. BG1 TaxID=1170699 RepID=UPI0015B94AE0|nr:polysaccharide pyruvyl transferase family protein [Galbibacter sp. BG1]QLE02799.1 polysaccharide pyruvyl transferase family protein [Galbibacter sp. BG1]
MEKGSLVKKLKRSIPFETKIQLRLTQLKFTSKQQFFKLNSKKRRIFIFLAADYGNLGDVAITYAQHKFLKQTYPDCQVIEIPISKTLQGIVQVKKIISSKDIITTVGGGNMGDLYHQIEYFRQLVIENFPKNKIISFPQTIDFSTSKEGKIKLSTAIKVYSNHKDLSLIAREQKSYDFFKKHFNNNVILLPDMVTTLDRSLPRYERNGVLICLRNDKERKLSEAQNEALVTFIKDTFSRVEFYDTHVGGQKLSMKSKLTSLFKIWDEFKQAELVITDRLHGMIFCHITNTPALVFLNNNHKIVQSFEWIKHNPRIKLVKEYRLEEIPSQINGLLKASENTKVSLLDSYKNFKTIV